MVEVFRTNVKDHSHAGMLIGQIHFTFPGYRANFDLEDCDRILRVTSATGSVESCHIIALLAQWGFGAEVLPDIIPSVSI
jgi:hypothetical protein